ncbi:MAG: response regulator transcription factor [Acidobacteria bacterium]|nr:response regulator transcription factor [Acidobacteriota bacterium]
MAIHVLLADDHTVVREGLRGLLEREGMNVAGEASNGQEAVKAAAATQPDVAILDVTMPALNGLDAAREIVKVSPRTKCLMLTMHDEDRYVLEALRAGVKGYVLKTQASLELAQAVREVHRGGIYLSPGISSTVVDAYLKKIEVPIDPLTARERQVLQLVAEGKTTKEIAELISVGAKTAESYRARIMQKLGIHHTAGLVRYAIRHGMVQP